MHSHANRALPAAAAATLVLLFCALMGTPPPAHAQQYGRRTIQPNQPGQINPTRPAIVTPVRPTVVYPQRPAMVQPVQPVTSNPVVSRPMQPSRPITTYPVSSGVSPGIQPQPWPSFPVRPVPSIGNLPPVVKPVPPIGNLPPPWWWKPSPPCYLPPPCIAPLCPVVVVVPSFPSAFIGPEFMRVTTFPSDTEAANVPAPSQMQPEDPAALQGNEATPRLIAIVGRIERVDASLPLGSTASGVRTATGGDGDQLCIGLGTLTTYFNPDPDQPTEAMARGSYFGSRWDGDTWHTSATGLWSRGPVTRQPLFTLHELQPSAFPFEVALPGRRITSLRMAIALVRDLSPPITAPSSSSPRSPAQSTSRSTLPFQSKLRHLTMANSLRRHLQESNEPVPLVPLTSSPNPAPTPALAPVSPSETYLGNAHSPFGQALSDSLQELLTTSPFPQPSGSTSVPQPPPTSGSVSASQPPLNHRSATAQPSQPSFLGSAEWTLPLSDLRDIMSGCPRFTTLPLPADLQTVRSRDTSPAPLWVRPFRIEAGADSSSGSQPVTYQGEVWFLIVPDGAIHP